MSKRVFICVGHGGSDSGAIGYVTEKAVTLTISLAAKAELERHGVTVGISRTRDEEDGLSKEVQLANAFNPDVVIAVHANAGGGDGFEAYVQTNRFAGRSRSAAKEIECRVEALGQNSRGIKTKLGSYGDYYYWLRNVEAPTVLLEGFFVDNREDVTGFDTVAEQQQLGKAYAWGLLDYLGIKVNTLPFVDVPVDSFYYKAVKWAYENHITTGTEKNKFSPDAPCTRGQAVTMLYRMYGGDSSVPHGFDDVDSSDYFNKAVQWAKAKGITKGVDASHFAPKEHCTRGQIVTMLYRAAGSPSVSGSIPFNDVKETDYFVNAVKWAKAKGITKGVGNGKFAPEEPCTRAEMVTFLHRA